MKPAMRFLIYRDFSTPPQKKFLKLKKRKTFLILLTPEQNFCDKISGFKRFD